MDDPKTRILIVEDDENIALYIQTCLVMGDYENEIAGDGLQAVEMIANGNYDLILLDIMLPSLDGFEVFKRTKHFGVPVIFLTAVQNIADKVKGLRLGAEDYIVKPFEALELLARIEVVLRRNQKVKNILRYGDIKIDVSSHRATRNEEYIPLTPKEFEVLAYFVRHQNMVISRENLLASIWGFEFVGETRTVDTHVQQVRRKMGLKGKLITVPKYGYRLTGSE